MPVRRNTAGCGGGHQTGRDKQKGCPARSQAVGRDGAGPGIGQQPLPGFLTALLFEAGSWTSRKWATSLPTKERKRLECLSSTSRAHPGAGDGSLAKAADPLLSQATRPPPCVWPARSPLPAKLQILQALTYRPSCPRDVPRAAPSSSLRACSLWSC